MHIKQHGAGRIADVGAVNCAGAGAGLVAAGELPHQPAVNCAKSQLAVFSLGAGTRQVVQQPFQFCAGEIGVHQQAGFGLYQRRLVVCTQRRAGAFGTPVLPDDGVGDGLAGASVPHDSGFALVGDAERPDVVGLDAQCLGLFERLPGRSQLTLPNLHWVVLYPARSRVDLWQFLLGLRHDATGGIKHNAA